MTNLEKGMTGEQCMMVIKKLACQQGFYTHLNNQLKALKRVNPDGFTNFMQKLEGQNFIDQVDLILYLEIEKIQIERKNQF